MSGFGSWFEDAGASRVDAAERARRARAGQGAVRARRARRRMVRGSAVVLLFVVGWFVVGLVPEASSPSPSPSPSVVAVGPAPRGTDLAIVRDDPGVLARYAAPARQPDPRVWLDDADLLALLAQHGRPTGLIRVAGRVIVTAPVEDPLLE